MVAVGKEAGGLAAVGTEVVGLAVAATVAAGWGAAAMATAVAERAEVGWAGAGCRIRVDGWMTNTHAYA